MQRGDISKFTVQYERNMTVCITKKRERERDMVFLSNHTSTQFRQPNHYLSGICSKMLDDCFICMHGIIYEMF